MSALQKQIEDPRFSWADLKRLGTLLKEGLRFNAPEWDAYSLLNYIFGHKHVDVRKELLKLLFEYGCLDPDFRGEKGENLIQVFVNNHVKSDDSETIVIVKVLKSVGVSVNHTDKSRRTLLHNSVATRNIELVNFFLNNNVNVNKKNSSRKSPLHLVANDEFCCLDIVKLLVSSGAQVDVKDGSQRTPLYYACKWGHEETISLLVRNQASISAEDSSGKTPFSSILTSNKNNNSQCLVAMVKEIALMHFKKVQVPEKDMNLLHNHPEAWMHFNKCLDELGEMSSTYFYPGHTYFSVLKRRVTSLARLDKTEEVVTGFEMGLHRFHYYAIDLERTFITAIKIGDALKAKELELKKVFGNYLPYLAVRKITNCVVTATV